MFYCVCMCVWGTTTRVAGAHQSWLWYEKYASTNISQPLWCLRPRHVHATNRTVTHPYTSIYTWTVSTHTHTYTSTIVLHLFFNTPRLKDLLFTRENSGRKSLCELATHEKVVTKFSADFSDAGSLSKQLASLLQVVSPCARCLSMCWSLMCRLSLHVQVASHVQGAYQSSLPLLYRLSLMCREPIKAAGLSCIGCLSRAGSLSKQLASLV